MRGFIGFIEETILHWLPERGLSRENLERLIFAAAGNTLITGLVMDGAIPPGVSVVQFRKAYRKHFALP